MTKINPIIDELRLDAGIARTAVGSTLIVARKDYTVEDPMVGLQKFAELVIKECINILQETADDIDNGDIFRDQALLKSFEERWSAGLYYGIEKIQERLLGDLK